MRFPTESSFPKWTTRMLACLLVAGACHTEPPDGDVVLPNLALDRMEVEQKEALLGQLTEDLAEENGSSLYNLGILKKYSWAIEKTLGGLDGVRVLEIGPGRNLAVGMVLVLQGARRYSAVDIYQHPRLYDPVVYRNLYRLTKISRGMPAGDAELDELMQVEDGRVHLDPDRIEWLYPHESYDFPMADGAVDFAFSHSGFEHFNEPRKTIERLFQVLRPGGVTAHSIDLRDHRDFSRPYAFLKLGAEEWRAHFTAENLHNYTNRWRAVDFRRAFEDAGFEIIEDRRKEAAQVTEEMKRSFHVDFQEYSLEDLSSTGLWIVAKKPDSGVPDETRDGDGR